MRHNSLIFASTTLLLLAAAPALAATTVASTPVVASTDTVRVVDFTPILSQLLELGGIIIMGVVTLVVARASQFVKAKIGVSLLEKDGLINQQLERSLQNAIKYGVQKVGSVNFAHIDVKNGILSEALGYAVSHAPEAMKHFGISEDSVREKLLPRLQQYIDSVGSPVQTSLVTEPSTPTQTNAQKVG